MPGKWFFHCHRQCLITINCAVNRMGICIANIDAASAPCGCLVGSFAQYHPLRDNYESIKLKKQYRTSSSLSADSQSHRYHQWCHCCWCRYHSLATDMPVLSSTPSRLYTNRRPPLRHQARQGVERPTWNLRRKKNDKSNQVYCHQLQASFFLLPGRRHNKTVFLLSVLLVVFAFSLGIRPWIIVGDCSSSKNNVNEMCACTTRETNERKSLENMLANRSSGVGRVGLVSCR